MSTSDHPDYTRPEPSALPQAPRPAVPRAPSRLPFLLVVLGGLLLIYAVPYLAQHISYAITRGEERAKYDVAREELAGIAPVTSPYRMAAKVIEPSVVGIYTTRLVTAADRDWPFFRQQQQALGQGSGVIVDQNGYIVTNSHVVSDAMAVVVKLPDGRVVQNAQVVGADPVSDLAVVKIDVGDLTAAQWGNSEDLEVGDEVLAVGNPYGLDRSVTAGIVSALARHVDRDNADRSFLQTDAAVNPGNSGGPLVNLRGEVVGINTAIVGPSYQGISFAIPSQLAQRVFERLKTTGVDRGYLGVALQDLTPELAEKLGVKEPQGAVVTGVVEGSPAAQASLEPGDVIVALGDHTIRDSEDLRLRIAQAKPGQQVKISLYRDGRRTDVSVTVGQRPMRLRR